MPTKILIVEDEPAIRMQVAEFIRMNGYEAFEAANGQLGIELAKTLRPDLIISDIQMPLMSGFDVLKAVRQTPEIAATPFIFLTAQSAYTFVRQGMDIGADDYLTKPFSLTQLLKAITTRLAKHEAVIRQYVSKIKEREQELNHTLTQVRELTTLSTQTSLEKDTLLHEIHHRVKNNLQIINSLLSLQAEYIHDPMMLNILKNSQSRIYSLALIQEHFYQSKDFAHIDMKSFGEEMVNNLVHFFRGGLNPIDLDIHIDEVVFKIETAIPCGLILNELVSNSIKHAFPSYLTLPTRQISVGLKAVSSTQYELMVGHNGAVLPPEAEQAPRFGLQLVNLLVQQIGGVLRIEREPQQCFMVTFPVR